MSLRTKKVFSIMMAMVIAMTSAVLVSDRAYAAGSNVTITGAKYPTTLTVGKKFTVKGKITSSKKMSRVEIGIVKVSNNKWTRYKYDNRKVNSRTFNVKRAAKKLKFNKLPAGKYAYRIYAHTKDGVSIVLNQRFTVKKKEAAEKLTINILPTLSLTNSSDATEADKTSKVLFTGFNTPKKYNVGKKFNIKGKISCNDEIRRVEIGIVVDSSNKWTEYKYDNKSVNAKSFDISVAAPALKFEELPGGNFKYRIYAHTDYGVAIVLDKEFEVIPSDKPLAAIKWATKIANNDKFTYGKGYGGYFTCCVCKNKIKKKAHAKFTCMPFLAAAYAHGTKDPDLMNNGRHIMNLNDDNFKGKLGNAWFKVGLCKDLDFSDLQPGDVIIKWSATNDSGHSWMYGGEDKIIEAVPADIQVLKSGASAKFRRYATYEGTPSKNYVMRYRH